MDDIFKNIEEYNANKKRKILIMFDDNWGRKLKISLVFITEYYHPAPKNIKLNSTHYFIMKIPNSRELQQTTFNHSSDIEFQDFMNLYKKYITKDILF